MNKIRDIISASIAVKQQLLADEKLLSTLSECVDVVVKAFKNGNKVLFCGNGGSAGRLQWNGTAFRGARPWNGKKPAAARRVEGARRTFRTSAP